MKFQREGSRREQFKLNRRVGLPQCSERQLKDIHPDYYISKLLKPRPPIVLIMEETTSLGERIRES
jgi:hypothetical protein